MKSGESQLNSYMKRPYEIGRSWDDVLKFRVIYTPVSIQISLIDYLKIDLF